MTELATHTARFPGGPTVSERAVFHKELGRAETRIRAARAIHREAMAAAWESAVAGTVPGEELQLAVTTASVYAVETCADVVTDLFRYGGGRGLSQGLGRHLDVQAGVGDRLTVGQRRRVTGILAASHKERLKHHADNATLARRELLGQGLRDGRLTAVVLAAVAVAGVDHDAP